MRRLVASLLALLVFAFTGNFLLWRWAEDALVRQTAAWIESRRTEGWRIETGASEAGGWPFAAELLLPAVVVAGGDTVRPRGLAWHVERLRLRVALRHPSVLDIIPEGRQSLVLDATPAIEFSAGTMTATVPLAMDRVGLSVVLTATGLRADGPMAAGGVTIAGLSVRAATQAAGAPSFHLDARADRIALPADIDWALGPTIAAVAFDGTMDGMFDPLGPLGAQLAAWRDTGGTLPVRSLSVIWGPLDLNASASLTLDAALQPEGTATVRMVGWNAALDALARTRVLPARSAMAAKAVLSLLARTPESGGPDVVDVPLTDRQHTLSFGHLPLTKLPFIVWPGG